MLKRWAVGSFFSRKYSRRAHRDPQKFVFFKTSKWEKWCSWRLRMTNAFILCNLLWKVQKGLAANREGSFNFVLSSDVAQALAVESSTILTALWLVLHKNAWNVFHFVCFYGQNWQKSINSMYQVIVSYWKEQYNCEMGNI